ncbi:unnamed protein product [Adineta steineri]|uniref:SGNH hydrolase-type esterase domain-containing protein n=1 Tax=Adineta steineri TaxID=433720 RepID=A0A814WP00_9BILA|nr:unnamed protein product [Adineta steineri]CAF1408760.1 unnamed protein product [Adineta steineri]
MLASFFVLLSLSLIIGSYEQNVNSIVAIGDSFTGAGSGGGVTKSYPIVAGNILRWPAVNYAKGGAVMKDIPGQLVKAASALASATHVVFTIGGNDLGVANSLLQVILANNITGVTQKAKSLKPQLVSTYNRIKAAVRPQTKIYAVAYVDFISVGNKIPNEASCHKIMDILTDTIKEATQEAGIAFIESVKTCFVGHEMFSSEPFVDSLFASTNAAHPNSKGYAKIGELVAAHLLLDQ